MAFLFSGCLHARQPEPLPNLQSSLKPKPAPSPSFPRRRESWWGLNNVLFYQDIAEQQTGFPPARE